MTWEPVGNDSLTKEGKVWWLEYRGERVKLSRRASFDHAEGAMRDIDNRN